MSYRVQFTPEVRDQLDRLEAYIAEAGSPSVAARYIDSIVAFCEGLDVFPQRGTPRDDLVRGLRVTSYRRRVVIAFVVDVPAEVVSIIGIFYGGQNYEVVLTDDE